MRRLVLATKNPGKVIEIKEILGRLPIEVVAVFAYKDIPEIEENGETFEENAVHKALATAKAQEVALADDSGLGVDAFWGARRLFCEICRGRLLVVRSDKANYESFYFVKA